MPTPYKLKLLNGILKLKTMAEYTISLLGIKDLGTQTGEVSNGLIDWSIQHFTKTTSEWNADTTTILLKGQLGVEDTGNTAFKIKIGNGTDLWADLSYLTGSGGSSTWGSITGTLSNQTDLQNALNAKENSITAGTTSQYWRGDKTFQTLDKTAVGLGNVDNTSDANKPVSTATQTALNAKVDANAAITGATKTKITYDSKGLVTSGADATTADIADSLNKRYVTDAQLTVIGNTSGTNTGDETVNTIGSLVNGAASATPNDTDLIPVVESSVTKKITLTNLKAFFKTYLDTLYVSLTGSYANPSWLTSLAWSKITGTPTTIAGYGITDAKPVGQWYSDATAVSPADGSVYYFGTINNNAPETANTYRIKSPKNNAVFNVTVTALVRTSLGSAQNSTIKIQNITAATSETLSTGLAATDRINSVTALSTLANTAGDEMTIEITNPSWVSNPTGVQYQFIVKAY